MKGWGKENFGDLNSLKKLEEQMQFDYTIEQLLDENLKNQNGESNLEVRKRMLSFFEEIIKIEKGKNIAIISHGAAIKYFLQNWCDYNKEKDCMIYNNEILCPRKIEYTGIIKIEVLDTQINNIEFLK